MVHDSEGDLPVLAQGVQDVHPSGIPVESLTLMRQALSPHFNAA